MRRRYHFHPPGLLYLVLVVVVAVAAANRPSNLLIWVFAAMLSGVLLSGLLSGQPLMGLHAERTVPRTARAGEAVRVSYSIANRSRAWPLFALFVRELDGPPGARAFVQHVGPRGAVVTEGVRAAERRGPMRFGPFRVETVFPFGLFLKSIRFDGHAECLVLPRTVRLRPGVLAGIVGGVASGPATAGRAGSGGDFLGIREYRPGDSLRHVAWRRSAKGGGLAVVERSVESPRRLQVVLDLRRPPGTALPGGRSARDLEEDAIVLAASLIASADAAGCETRLAVLGLPSPSMPSRRGPAHVQRQLAALAALDLDAPRTPGDVPAAVAARAATAVVHADRASDGVGGPGAVRLVAAELESLAAPAGAESAGEEAGGDRGKPWPPPRRAAPSRAPSAASSLAATSAAAGTRPHSPLQPRPPRRAVALAHGRFPTSVRRCGPFSFMQHGATCASRSGACGAAEVAMRASMTTAR